VKGTFKIWLVEEPGSAAVFGFGKLVMVISKHLFEAAEKKEMDAVIAHELIHLRRKDHWVALLQLAISVVWWFHPLVHWATRQLHRDEEVVTAMGENPVEYSKTLVSVVEHHLQSSSLCGVIGYGDRKSLQQRIQCLLDPHRHFRSRCPAWCWLVIMVVGLGTFSKSSLGWADQKGSSAKSSQKSKKVSLAERAHLQTIARLLANNLEMAVAFDSPREAEQIVSGIKESTDLAFAMVYRKEGESNEFREFAAYYQKGSKPAEMASITAKLIAEFKGLRTEKIVEVPGYVIAVAPVLLRNVDEPTAYVAVGRSLK
jgi:hypothetical protein